LNHEFGATGLAHEVCPRAVQKHRIWLWRATSHGNGEVIAFRFGTREYGNLDKLLELLKPLNIGSVYTDGSYRITGGFHRRF
jgi:IS1 family transposase